MKALEILEHLTTFCGVDLHNQCIEAIAELEALQQRSCKGCKAFNGTQICDNFIARSGYESKDFCCNRYEPKEQ